MKYIATFCLISSLFLSACLYGDETRQLEDAIRAEVVKESADIASLEAIYLVSYMYFQENLITSDDVYIQKDTVSIDYGFKIDDNSIHVVDTGTRKKLEVRLHKGKVLAINRISLERPETTHEGYLPKDTKGNLIDIDAAMNREIEQIKNEYEERNLKTAEENIKNFFKILATKYDLELDFKVES